MKLKTLTSAVGLSLALLSSSAFANPGAYAGVEVGQSSFHNGIDQFKQQGYGVHRNSATTGVFGGYEFNDYVAVEGAYTYLGRAKANLNGADTLKHTVHGPSLVVKGSYPVTSDLSVYGKTGVAVLRSDYRQTLSENDKVKEHRTKPSLVLGAGVDYAITPAVHAQVEYKWYNNVGKLGTVSSNAVGVSSYSPDVSMVTAGLSYHFGQGNPVPEVVSKSFTFGDQVLFDFSKSKLKPQAKEVLDRAASEIKQVKDPVVKVEGFADRLGSETYNAKLSKDRAETVASYLATQAPATYEANGRGSDKPVTGHNCDRVKGHKTLIECLAPDRRVEIDVKGLRTEM